MSIVLMTGGLILGVLTMLEALKGILIDDDTILIRGAVGCIISFLLFSIGAINYFYHLFYY